MAQCDRSLAKTMVISSWNHPFVATRVASFFTLRDLYTDIDGTDSPCETSIIVCNVSLCVCACAAVAVYGDRVTDRHSE